MSVMKKTALVRVVITLATLFLFSNGQHGTHLGTKCETEVSGLHKNEKDVDQPINACKNIVCYVRSDAINRKDIGRQYPKDIDASLCTHVIYYSVNLVNGKKITNCSTDDTLIKELMEKKKSHPDLKTLVSVGGWSMGSEPFTDMVAAKSSRKTFIDNAIQFLRKYDFEGLDLHWMYPGNRGSPPEDKQRFSSLLKELRSAFDNEVIHPGKSKLLLTAACAKSELRIHRAYEVKEVDKYVDFIILLTMDYNGAWDLSTGHNSPLKLVKGTAENWVEKGASREKLIIGLATYGRTFTLQDSTLTGYGAPTNGAKKGPYTMTTGVLSYFEICDVLRRNETVTHLHDDADPYCVYKDQWIGYEDENSLKIKVEYVLRENYGGVMVWEIGMDDFRGVSCEEGKFPLLTAINDACHP